MFYFFRGFCIENIIYDYNYGADHISYIIYNLWTYADLDILIDDFFDRTMHLFVSMQNINESYYPIFNYILAGDFTNMRFRIFDEKAIMYRIYKSEYAPEIMPRIPEEPDTYIMSYDDDTDTYITLQNMDYEQQKKVYDAYAEDYLLRVKNYFAEIKMNKLLKSRDEYNSALLEIYVQFIQRNIKIIYIYVLLILHKIKILKNMMK